MLSFDQNQQLNEIFKEVGKTLDITPAEYEAAVKSYEFVGDWLSKPDSALAVYEPEIRPQGSFLLGTMTRPVHEEENLDVDLVCRLTGKLASWTQYDVKKIVGDRLKQHETLKRMLDIEGRRCWTLNHHEAARFHLDVLPSIVSRGYRLLFESKMSADDLQDVEKLAIRITDKQMKNYAVSTDVSDWLKSNPFGYAVWFKLRSMLDRYKLFSLNEAIQPIPPQENKSLLQIIVQILKRHRDLMFNGDCDKPISIIITTLAAKAYNRQNNLIDGLVSVVNTMENFVEQRVDAKGVRIKWISNPVNPQENFADKWAANPLKQANFERWVARVKADLENILSKRGYELQSAIGEVLGKKEVNKAFANLADGALRQREGGGLKMAAGSGIIGSVGRTVISQHTNYGSSE